MSKYLNIINLNHKIKAALRHAFARDHLILEQLKISDFPNVIRFIQRYTNNKYLESIDIFVVNGILLKNNLPAYALFYDGDEDDLYTKAIILTEEGKIDVAEVIADSPIILISKSIINNKLLFETTLVHEIVHFIDGIPSGEDVARQMEFNFLINIYQFDTQKANKFLKKKYLITQ